MIQIPDSRFKVELQNGSIVEIDCVDFHSMLEKIPIDADYFDEARNLLKRELGIAVTRAEALVINLRTIEAFDEWKKKLPTSLQSLFTTRSTPQPATSESTPYSNAT